MSFSTLLILPVACLLGAANPSLPVHFPQDYDVAAYLNCGGEAPPTLNGKEVLRVETGSPLTFEGTDEPLGAVICDPKQVLLDIAKLDPGQEYLLAFCWWDVDQQGRRCALRFSNPQSSTWTTVLPPTVAAAFYKDKATWARTVMPIPKSTVATGGLQVAFTKESGPDVCLSEVWLLKKSMASAKKRVLILTGDDYKGHRWRETAPELAAILREDSRLEVSISEIPAMLESPLLPHYDAIVLHFKNYEDRLPLDQAIGKGLAAYVASGRGLVLAHFAGGAFQDWPGFVEVAGRVWNPKMRAHDPHAVFTVHIVDEEHPVSAGLADFDCPDELYTCLDGETPIQVICEAVSKVDKKAYPMAFSVPGQKGRVLHCPLGHDLRSFQAPGVRRLYQNAVCWAAGLAPIKKE